MERRITPREEGFQAARHIQEMAAAQKKPVEDLEDYVSPDAVLFILTMNQEMLTDDQVNYWQGYLSAWD